MAFKRRCLLINFWFAVFNPVHLFWSFFDLTLSLPLSKRAFHFFQLSRLLIVFLPLFFYWLFQSSTGLPGIVSFVLSNPTINPSSRSTCAIHHHSHQIAIRLIEPNHNINCCSPPPAHNRTAEQHSKMASLIHDIIKYAVLILCLINVVLVRRTFICFLNPTLIWVYSNQILNQNEINTLSLLKRSPTTWSTDSSTRGEWAVNRPFIWYVIDSCTYSVSLTQNTIYLHTLTFSGYNADHLLGRSICRSRGGLFVSDHLR